MTKIIKGADKIPPPFLFSEIFRLYRGMVLMIYLEDHITWDQFGAPDPGFFYSHIKDLPLMVIGVSAHDEIILRDPSDHLGSFVIPRAYACIEKSQLRVNEKAPGETEAFNVFERRK